MRTLSTENSYLFNRILLDIVFPLPACIIGKNTIFKYQIKRFLNMWIADQWKDYEVIDTSAGEKLGRWGQYILVRPDPQVIWLSLIHIFS